MDNWQRNINNNVGRIQKVTHKDSWVGLFIIIGLLSSVIGGILAIVAIIS